MVSSKAREGAVSTRTAMFRIDFCSWRGSPSKASATRCSNARRRTARLLRLVHQCSVLLLLAEGSLPYLVLRHLSSTPHEPCGPGSRQVPTTIGLAGRTPAGRHVSGSVTAGRRCLAGGVE